MALACKFNTQKFMLHIFPAQNGINVNLTYLLRLLQLKFDFHSTQRDPQSNVDS